MLLIIFMLTAHVMDYGQEVDVPKTKITTQTNDVLPVVEIQAGADVVPERESRRNGLMTLRCRNSPSVLRIKKSVYIAADSSIRWDLLAQVLAELGGAHIAAKMVTKPIESRGQ